jgi:large subunit ribosomal protein L24
VQTTLLSFAIGLILALLAALVLPHFVRWNDHRAFFEAEASRLVGTKVRVGGDIDAALLPTPSVTLRAIAIGPAGEGSRMRARSLRMELALGPLMRGELRATEMRLVAPQFNIGLDKQGDLDWPPLALASEPLSIDRLSVENGHVTFTDANSKSRLELDQLWFTGEIRSLTGPIRGKGEFVTGGGLYGYELSAGRAGPDGTRVKLSLKTDERPLTIEADGLLSLDHASPRFEGMIALSRLAGAVLASGKAVAYEPWRLVSKVRAGPSSAALDDVAFQYGPDERAAALTGSGEFKFGAQPQLHGALSARQIDLDRLLATPQTPRHLPLAAVQAFGDMLGNALRPPWPVRLTLGVDAVAVGGGAVQNVAGELRSDGASWTLDKLELRAPGFSQVKMAGRLYPSDKGLGFAGGASLDSNDPKNLVAWLAGRATVAAQFKPWHVKGDVTLGADRIAVEHMRTEFDRGTAEGSLSYTWPSGNKPARLQGTLRAAELDLDNIAGFGRSALAGLGLERPGEIALAIEIGRTRLAGFDARDFAARLRLDANGLAIERLSIADLGDTSFVATGRIETTSAPGGSIIVDLDTRDFGGVIALAEKFTPALAEPLRRIAARQKTAVLRAALSLEDIGDDRANGKIVLSGQVGAVHVEISATATGKREAFSPTDLKALTGTEVRIDSRLDADEAGPLLALLGLDHTIAGDRRPARLEVTANGPLGRELPFVGKLAAGSLDAAGKGAFKLASDQPAMLDLEQFAGTLGGSKIQGRLSLRFGDTTQAEGSIDADSFDAPAVIAAAIGMPGRPTTGSGWSSDPLAPNSAGFVGHIDFKARQAILLPGLAVKDLRGVARFNGPEVVFENLGAEVGKGRFDGRLAIANGADGLSARLRVGLARVEASALFADAEHPPVSGRLMFETEIEGAGRSPAAFIGSLTGFGSIELQNGWFAGLNPDVFGAVTRAVELGIPTEGNRIRRFVTGALDNAGLPVARASAAVSIMAGQAHLREIVIKADGANLQAIANLDLADATLDAMLTLDSLPTASNTARPAVLVALKGSLPLPTRTVDPSLLSSWLTLRAVEQQTKRIDAMERARREAAAAKATQPEAADKGPAALPPALEAAPATPEASPSSPEQNSDGARASPAPITIPTAPNPRAAPRADNATPPRAATQPPASLGAQN